jgi:hypothetical protein
VNQVIFSNECHRLWEKTNVPVNRQLNIHRTPAAVKAFWHPSSANSSPWDAFKFTDHNVTPGVILVVIL